MPAGTGEVRLRGLGRCWGEACGFNRRSGLAAWRSCSLQDWPAPQLPERIDNLGVVVRFDREAQAVEFAQLPATAQAIGEVVIEPAARCLICGDDPGREALAEMQLRREVLRRVANRRALEVEDAGDAVRGGIDQEVLVSEVAVTDDRAVLPEPLVRAEPVPPLCDNAVFRLR